MLRHVKTILLIDDDPDESVLIDDALKVIGSPIHFISVSGCIEALDLLKGNSSLVPDLILLDLNMPVVNGKRCLVELKKIAHLRKVPIIIYSTTSSVREKEEVMSMGASSFWTKPESITDLCKSLTFELYGVN